MPSLLDLLGETWPARMAKNAWSAAKLPGDVYAGRVDPLSDEGIGRAADLGGLVMGGTFAGAPAGAMGAGAVKPIRAYHGSPHDFERFDLSKIGTGEGAQAYGHGLYFAENPATAKSYRDALSGVNRFDSKQTGELLFDVLAEKSGVGLIDGKVPFGPNRSLISKEDLANGMASGKYSIFDVSPAIQRAVIDAAPRGRMYEVNINADPAHFLDWDKALSQQPQNVAETLKSMGLYSRQTSTGAHYDPAGSVAYDALKVPRTSSGNDVAATNMLREAGIPGIKYLDQGSRGNWMVRENPKGFYGIQSTSPGIGGAVSENFPTRELAQDWVNKQQSSNYVLFRDDIIDIVKKYGLAGAAAMYGISQDEAKAAMDNPRDKNLSIGRQTYADEE